MVMVIAPKGLWYKNVCMLVEIDETFSVGSLNYSKWRVVVLRWTFPNLRKWYFNCTTYIRTIRAIDVGLYIQPFFTNYLYDRSSWWRCLTVWLSDNETISVWIVHIYYAKWHGMYMLCQLMELQFFLGWGWGGAVIFMFVFTVCNNLTIMDYVLHSI